MNDNELLIIVLESQIKLLKTLVNSGKKGDMEKLINHFKKRVEDLKNG